MKRVAFTIILNGINHLKHKDYYKTMSTNFDYWFIVEGVSNPGGSTAWCNALDNSFHNNFISNDGTSQFLDNLEFILKQSLINVTYGKWI